MNRTSLWRQTRTIAAFTALEALRGRLLLLLGLTLAAAVLFAEFLGAIAVTESAPIKVALMSGLLRLVGVFLVSLFVATSVAREFADKGMDLILSLPLPRASYHFGKLLGYMAIAAITALLFGLVVTAYAPASQALFWAVSLFCEMLIVAAVTLLCMFTLTQVPAALTAVTAFYVLSRSIAAIQLMGHGPLMDPTAWSQRLITAAVDGLAFLLPELHRFTPGEWLVYHTATVGALLPLLAQTLIYVALLTGAGLFDLYRKNF